MRPPSPPIDVLLVASIETINNLQIKRAELCAEIWQIFYQIVKLVVNCNSAFCIHFLDQLRLQRKKSVSFTIIFF